MLGGVVVGAFKLYINNSRIFRVLFLFCGVIRSAVVVRASGKTVRRFTRAVQGVLVAGYRRVRMGGVQSLAQKNSRQSAQAFRSAELRVYQ